MDNIFKFVTSKFFWGNILTSTIVVAIINIFWRYVESKITFRNSRQLQVDNFYREVSGKSLHKLLKDWSDLLFFALDKNVQDKMNNVTYMSELLQRTFLYSSEETIRRLMNFQQYLYQKDKEEQEYDGHIVMVLVAGVITSIKYDFTGETISVESVLRIKLTDVDEYLGVIKQTMKDYEYK